ncbi:fatty acid desaturase family protein [Stakelama tenebrarum]|uniref:Fatty acid desaturase n=1 Tax=Stakelama tenebrarum TaxID=2711215 RepID=A0A6G6Y539_9SPHN|nr:fatty acid desaturase [Sphingosinithalassobacter tenebrarum]QIG79838.1 fatty acid desaturase [Sphingosinithalassobacter tenebrarum]
MTDTFALKPADAPTREVREPRIRLSGVADDREMMRAAAELTRDLQKPKQWLYWTDCLVSAAIGYAALVGAVLAPNVGWALLAGVVSILALYRATLFIHEITHVKHSLLPGFRTGWNVLVGMPMMLPSFMYEGIHAIHHSRTRYGTAEDPEYLPLAHMKPSTLPIFLLVSVLMPVGLLIRFGILTPLSLIFPKLRRVVVAKYSGLQINPGYERKAPTGEFRRQWAFQETICSIWAIGVIALVATGILPLKAFAIYMGVISGVAVINQVRTLVAHLWENEGEPLTVTAQFLDSVNVPPPSFLPYLWAPVGLRYHALHHLLPSLPYHSLTQAHYRLTEALGLESTYHKASYPTLSGLMARLANNTMKPRDGR